MPETSWPVLTSALGGAFGSRLGPRPGSSDGGLLEGGGSAGVEGAEPAGGMPVLGGTPLEPPPLEPPPLEPPPLEPPPLEPPPLEPPPLRTTPVMWSGLCSEEAASYSATGSCEVCSWRAQPPHRVRVDSTAPSRVSGWIMPFIENGK